MKAGNIAATNNPLSEEPVILCSLPLHSGMTAKPRRGSWVGVSVDVFGQLSSGKVEGKAEELAAGRTDIVVDSGGEMVAWATGVLVIILVLVIIPGGSGISTAVGNCSVV